jgi:hypothetical protein
LTALRNGVTKRREREQHGTGEDEDALDHGRHG